MQLVNAGLNLTNFGFSLLDQGFLERQLLG